MSKGGARRRHKANEPKTVRSPEGRAVGWFVRFQEKGGPCAVSWHHREQARCPPRAALDEDGVAPSLTRLDVSCASRTSSISTVTSSPHRRDHDRRHACATKPISQGVTVVQRAFALAR